MVEAINIIREARDLVGCRVVRLDCRPDPHLIAYYNSYGFQEIKKDTNGDELAMMVTVLRTGTVGNPIRILFPPEFVKDLVE